MLNYYYYIETKEEDMNGFNKLEKYSKIVKEKLKASDFMQSYVIQMVSKQTKNTILKKKVTPLKLAILNNFSREIILDFMSRVKVDTSDSLCHLFPEVVGDKNFTKYFDSLLN